MHLNYAWKVDSITCFRQQLFYLTELNSTPEIKPSLPVATVVAQYSKLSQPFLSRHATLLLLCWEECCVTRQNTAARETSSARVTRRFNRYFIYNNNKKKKKKKINIITIININIDNNNNNNNSHEDLDQLLITEPQYRF